MGDDRRLPALWHFGMTHGLISSPTLLIFLQDFVDSNSNGKNITLGKDLVI